MFEHLLFGNPLFLLLILLIPVIFYFKYRRQQKTSIHFPTVAYLRSLPVSWRSILRPILPFLRGLSLILLIIALARPQWGVRQQRVTEEGIDILLAVDVSTSMLAEDFKIANQRYNRLDIVKQVLADFIPRRINDRLGMVVFGGRPYTIAPLTWDQDWLTQRLAEIKVGMVEDGTAIGSAIMISLERLKDSQAKSKVLILLTDGQNNQGEIQPKIAAEAAKALGIKIYTIGAGSRGVVPYPMSDPFGRTVYRNVQIDIDEQLLTEIADKTGGQYYRALDTEDLYQIYEEINQLEKTEIEMNQFYQYRELFGLFILLGLLFLGIEIVLQNTLLRRLP